MPSSACMQVPPAALLLLLLPLAAGQAVISVDAHGARPDNSTVNTAAFRSAAAAARDAAAKGGAAVLLVPGPGIYITGCFNLSSGVALRVAGGATVYGVASTDGAQFTVVAPLPSYGKSRDKGFARHQALIMTEPGSSNIKIEGNGTIDGGGKFWWDLFRANKLTYGRPRMLEIYNSSNVEVAGLTLKDSGFWTVHPIYSSNIHIHDLNITAPGDSPNTDGVDPDSSANVLVERCTISCGDDHIAIKSGINTFGRAVGIPSVNITVRHNTHFLGRGISIGSEVSGGVEHVRVYDVMHFGPAEHGLHIKTSSTRGGYIQDVYYRNVTLGVVTGDSCLSLTTDYGHSAGNGSILTDISGIVYEDVRTTANASARGSGGWSCFEANPCENITLHNVDLHPGARAGWQCLYAEVKAMNVTPSGVTAACAHA